MVERIKPLPHTMRSAGHIYDFNTHREGQEITLMAHIHFGGSQDLLLLLSGREPIVYLIDLLRLAYDIERRTLPHWEGYYAVANSILRGATAVHWQIESKSGRNILWVQKNQ